MKYFLLLLFSLGVLFTSAQTSQTHVVATITAMKNYYGAANRIHVTATTTDYVICSPCTPDEITIFAGSGGRKWKTLIPAALDSSTNLGFGLYYTPSDTTLAVDSSSTELKAYIGRYAIVDLTSRQPIDPDLTTIAGLTPTTGNIIMSVGSAWASSTPTAVKTTLALNNVDNTSDATKNAATATLTNKRWTARIGSTTSSATPTINTNNFDIFKITAQTVDITSFTINLTGTPVDGDILEIQITGTASRAITWGASFVGSTIPLPTTTVGVNTLSVVYQYFTTSSYGNNKWVLASSF